MRWAQCCDAPCSCFAAPSSLLPNFDPFFWSLLLYCMTIYLCQQIRRPVGLAALAATYNTSLLTWKLKQHTRVAVVEMTATMLPQTCSL